MSDHDEFYRTDPKYRAFYDRTTGKPPDLIPGMPQWMQVLLALALLALVGVYLYYCVL